MRVGGLILGLPGLLLSAAACATASPVGSPVGSPVESMDAPWVFELEDARGDTRLSHPPHPALERSTFDLERVRLERIDGAFRLEATFAAPIPTLSDVRAARDRVVEMVPMTLDVYLDTREGEGRLEALPGRGFKVSAAEAWDHVLVVSGLADLSEDHLTHAQRVTVVGRRLVATFPDRVPGEVRGVLVVVLATSPSGTGRVRQVGTHGECRAWDDTRCVLSGTDPPVIDALGVEVGPGAPLAMVYPSGERPRPQAVPVVFVRGRLIGAAPVEAGEVKAGGFATLIDEGGAAVATAVVLNVVGDTCSLEVLGEVPPEALARASAVVFADRGAERP